jgi:hypothetical protein
VKITSYISRSPHQGRDEFVTLLSGFFVACIVSKGATFIVENDHAHY